MNVHNSKRTIPWRLPMLITTVQIKGIINKAVTIIKEITTTKVGKIIPTKAGETTITKREETMVETKGGTIVTNKTGINKRQAQITQPQVPQITYPSSSFNQDETLRFILQGQKELQTTLTSSITSLTSTFQALITRMDPPSTANTQPSSSSALLSQPLPNSKGGNNAITLRSGTTLQERSPEELSSREAIQDEDVVEVEDVEDEDEVQEVVEEEVAQPRDGVSKEENVSKEAIPIPFPHLSRRTSKYAKFLKDLCMNKEKIHDLETIPLNSSISALMGAISEKCCDLGPCLVTCTIVGIQFVDCMCDLDKSIFSVVGIAEDVLVSIKGLTFPIDFYILEMPPNDSGRPSSILHGRPFLKTSRFKLDAFSSTYSFENDGKAVSFNLDEAMKHPLEDHSIFRCDIIDNIVAKVHQDTIDEKNMVQGACVGKPFEYDEDTLPPPVLLDNQVPSHELNMELKPLPPHLKYAYLKQNQKLPVIIAKELTSQQEERLLNVLRRNKKAIG
nr:uncharacterized protein LOC112721359 [Arachis hypogaea]